jgi:death-on-curing protein
MHDRAIADQGGMPGIRSQHGLEAALFRPQATFAGEETHPTLEAKGAALIEGIVCGHPFVDGNKRTGILVLETFLN